ncbi:hypothetical protein WA026_019615 [Henosepilachna vigintioctopunctata]|uniref:Uncharacterized protein n=1 Tax=Henosepilachna vigintioctopunctata TaxID=420089 RepID=A0AAW1TR57_9CUCU
MEKQNNMDETLESSYSIRILRDGTMNILSAMLNRPKVILTNEGLPRYWKGLAELCGIETFLIANLEFPKDSTRETLRLWTEKCNEATIRQLIEYLERLDRFDVVDDIGASIAEDIQFHKQHPNTYRLQPATPTLPPFLDPDRRILTTDDLLNLERNAPLTKYDAFILFAEDDIQFATKVIERMEKQYNLKFCAKQRDLVVGTLEHPAIITLISERCDKLIAILSPSFFNSPINKFFLNFTQHISIEQRKIIPCLYKPCPVLPPEVRCLFMLDYTNSRMLCNFWDKLYESITNHKPPSNTNVSGDDPPRQLIIKTNSHRDHNSRPRPPNNHSVKFSSLVDLTNTDSDQILLDPNLNPSTSANSLGSTTYSETMDRRKIKPKVSWFRKMFQKYRKMYRNSNQHI